MQSSSLVATVPLTLVLAYLDCAHGRLGKTYCDCLLKHLGSAKEINITEWTFEMLATSALRAIAAAEAEQARFVIIATDGSSDLPEGAKEWCAAWCSSKLKNQGSVVVLLSSRIGCPDTFWPAYNYLKGKTSGCGRRFLVYTSGWDPEIGGSFCIADARRVTSTGLVAVEGFHEVIGISGGVTSNET